MKILKGHSKMKTYLINNISKFTRRLLLGSLMLLAFAGSAEAQNDPWHVIKMTKVEGGETQHHYLAHVKVGEGEEAHWELQDAITFNPATCLWRSGNTTNVYGLHHNYYFIDDQGHHRFLSAPLLPNGTMSLSATLPSNQLLSNTDQIYYFYDWDNDSYGGGVARGHKYARITNPNDCEHSWSNRDQECWEVYWVEFNANNEWRLTPQSHYSRNAGEDNGQGGVPNAGLYRSVTVTEHEEDITGITNGLLPELQDHEMDFGSTYSPSINIPTAVTASSYFPAYTTYVFEGGTHNYYGGVDYLDVAPTETEYSGTYQSLEWTLSGDGADYLSFDETEDYSSSTSETPTIYYNRPNTTGHHTATLTLTVTYVNDQGQIATQERTATISLRSECINPGQAANPVVTYEGVTVSWYPTAEQYRVYLTTDVNVWTDYVEVSGANTNTFAGLLPDTEYHYKVVAYCSGAWLDLDDATSFEFTTKGEPGLLVYGAVFGGGRMADVGGKTEVAIINCDSIHAVYGGNDIAGTVQGTNGSTITLGVDEGGDYADYGTSNAPIRIGDVYGGGNGYYAYNGTSFEPASYNTVYTIAPDASIMALTQQQQLGDAVYTNTTSSDKELVCPTITKTAITVTNDYVKIDSLFGGAKNAILNNTENDVNITIDGGTIFAVYGGNNYGGSLGYKSHEHILVTNTLTHASGDYYSGILGRDFGIGYLFGGGNKVQGQNVHVTVEGGQIDTIFGGGNEADVLSTEVRIQCALGAFNETTGAFGMVYSDAIDSGFSETDLTDEAIRDGYLWNRTGVYNVRTLFGGNNRASMEDGVPSLVLTSGSIGTVYGGGNEGDMLAADGPVTLQFDDEALDAFVFHYGTHVQMNSANILIDYLYGGCQKSNVDYSTWVELQNGHVGTVYGGCNISGDVGSKRVHLNATSPSVDYQEVQGGTYVKASGGKVYKNLFGGSNGFYHCNDGVAYIAGVDYCEPENYVGWLIPTHNETHVIITGNALVKGNVYAGGNMAPVGFTNATVGERIFPEFVGLASLRMNGGEVHGNVFGGGNMASILGSNEVRVSGGSIGMSGNFAGALYGGNDRSGQAGQISNRVFPAGHDIASDGYTSLTNVNTYVSLTGRPDINTVYGGGNGDYDYEHGDDVIAEGQYCSYDEQGKFNDKPIQTNTFVDININGFPADHGGHINTVYGGGNGVTVTGSITVFLNVKGENGGLPLAYDQVGTIFGGNNKDNVVETGNVPLVPDIVLLHGQVGTVYGGCNKGAMTTGMDFTIGGNTYRNVGSMVRLRSSYQATTPNAPVVTPDAVVSNAVYGGCRMNDVYHNSLVLVEGGADVPANLFGGCDISGAVRDISYVVVTGGKVLGNIYAGGNGNYTYTDEGEVYSGTELVATGNIGDDYHEPPTSSVSRVDLLGGQVGADASHIAEVFGGGYGQLTNTTGDVIVNVGPATASSWDGLPLIYGNVYGGSAFGNVNTNSDNTTTVNFLNGTLHGNMFGGGLGRKAEGNLTAIEAKVFGKVFVNISNDDQTADNCFIDLRDADIYGCNNQNGSPQDDVRVDVWKTAFNFNDYQSGDKYTASYIESDADYAIDEVFGGGNQADYAPAGGESSTKKTTVYIHDCLNTIRRVFSGGNAAAAVGVVGTIQGGRMDYVFGGGNGEGTAANIGNGGTHLVVEGGTITHLFGGSNKTGNIAGPMYTEVNGDSQCNEEMDMHITDFFGGSNEAQLISDNVYSIIKCGAVIDNAYGGSNLANITGNVIFDVRGGTINNVFGGSKGVLNGTAANITGDVTLNLEGGKITNAFGGSDQNGNITGSITVNVVDYELEDCGLDLTNVYGGGNLTAYNPTDATSTNPVVNVMHIGQQDGIRGNVFGGGKQAAVNANTKVNIGYDATTMYGYLPTDLPEGLVPANFRAFVTGKVFGGGDEAGVGIGSNVCNTAVNMNNGTVLTGIYGGSNTSGTVTGNTVVNLFNGTIGESENANASIHGGGYGNATSIAGNVTVNFGDDTNIENTGLVLYGDLYGGSALGSVNTDGSNTTIVNLRNGIIHGAAYGGGLGHAEHGDWGWVKGKVYVRVGNATDPSDSDTYTGKANLVDCDVYGCNNLNGSPQNEVYVDIFQTAHDANNVYDNTDGGYAIHQVFGGGNQANFSVGQFKTHVYIHGCENTIGRVFGGGDAAAVYGTNVEIDGGRFNEMFGGGNGEVSPANVGDGGINIRLHGGLFNVVFNGSNQYGEITGEINYENIDDNVCDNLMILDHFLGSNQADIFGDITATIECSTSPMTFVNLYCGCNRAQIYGNINVVIKGGYFENVYGGSKGQLEPEPYSADVNTVTQDDIDAHPNEHLVLGRGGNINLTINGGTIGNLFGGGHINGNVEGKISITVDNVENSCGLFIGNIYGAGSYTRYEPTNPNGISPKVMIHNATVGGHTTHLPIYNNQGGSDYEGNVFGGGLSGDVTSNPEVIVGNSESSDVTIKGNVYGGGEVGIVDGNAQVVIVPKTHTFTYNSTPSHGQGLIRVTDTRGNVIPSGSSFTLGEHMELRIEAFPSVYGYKFDSWTVNGTGASVSSPQSASTTFVMGTDNASVTTSFVPVSTHTLSVNGPGNSVAVKDGLGNTVDLTQGISEGAELKITATAAQGYRFVRWDVVEGNGYMSNRYSTSTTFTMGTNNCTITAVFEIEP